MPFTFAHPAIVLPLTTFAKRYFSITALIIGSMVPDFEYFFRTKVHSVHSHTFAGLFYFDLPVGLIVYFLFVQFVRAPLVVHLPRYFRERFPIDYKEKNLLIIIYSLIVGAVSHLFWDSFTHQTGYVVEHIALLQQKIIINKFSFPVFKMLQHVSTLGGLFIIAYAIMRSPRNSSEFSIYWRPYWLIGFFIFDLVILGKYLTNNFVSFGDWVVTAISAGLLGLLLSSIIHHVRFSHR